MLLIVPQATGYKHMRHRGRQCIICELSIWVTGLICALWQGELGYILSIIKNLE